MTRVEYEKNGVHMLSVSENWPDKSFFRRLNLIPKADEAIANEVVYHGTCWVKAKREAASKKVAIENFVKTLSDIELLNLIELRFSTKPQEMITMNEINEIYRSILLENGTRKEELSVNYKKHLKEKSKE